MPTAAKTRTATITDIGAAYVNDNRETLMYARSAWYHWTGYVWEKTHDQVQSRDIWQILEDQQAKDHQVPSLGKKQALLDYIKAHLFVPENELDRKPNLINLQNGVYNLDDGNLYPHRPEYLITTILPFPFDAAAQCDMWQQFLLTSLTLPRSLEHDPELASFIQEAIGYSLTTDVSQHVTFWCVGEGANGKGVLFHVLEKLGGTSAITLNVGLLAKEQYQLARLAGMRIALCSEAESTNNLVKDALIKALVAGDTMSVRQIRQEPFELQGTAKLWWAMNELPPVADTSEGFWRRMRVIPFNRTFDKTERIPDLKEKLDLELPGIFNWAMTGLRTLRQRGTFCEPQQVLAATNRYREEANPVRLFVNECCDLDPAYHDSTVAIYDAYKAWCFKNNFKAQSSRNFKRDMERLGLFYRHMATGNVYDGVQLKAVYSAQASWAIP